MLAQVMWLAHMCRFLLNLHEHNLTPVQSPYGCTVEQTVQNPANKKFGLSITRLGKRLLQTTFLEVAENAVQISWNTVSTTVQ